MLDVIKRYRPSGSKYQKSVKNYIIADNDRAVSSMVQKAVSLGLQPVRFKGYLTGEARKGVGPFMDTPGDLVIGGGETTVAVKGRGRGGRNQEFVLAGLGRLKAGVICSIGTDGIDGNTDAAGALCDDTVKERARQKKLESKTYLANNNSYDFFRACLGLVKTGPTGTNVADLCVYLKKVSIIF